MFAKLIVLVLAVFVHQQAESLKIPSYFKPCARNDPNFNECAKKHGQDSLPSLMKGDRKYKIPPLDPLVLPELIVSQGGTLDIKLKNATIIGLPQTVVQYCNFDFSNKKISMKFYVPELMINSQYEINGRILVIPISGKGPSFLTLKDLQFTYEFIYDIVKKDNVEYLKPNKGKINYEIRGLKIKFENLFNGDKILGPETNNFLNENWKEVSKELGPELVEALAEIVNLILSNVSSLVPFNELFPETV